MRSPEELLEAAAADGSFDSSEWPRVLDFVFSRLKESVYNEFPRPSITKSSQVDSPRPTIINLKNDEPLSQESQTANKENNPPQRLQHTRSQGTIGIQNNDGDDINNQDADFPPEVLSSYNSICSTLAQSFPKSPPYTIQRLAELILRPRRHYRFLPPYLYALNRVLSVSSSTEAFPLPQAVLSPSSGLLNGTGASASTPSSTSYSAASNLGSDESLGGALLTPIPWLRSERDHQSRSEFKPESTETVDGPNGTGTIETVSVVNGHLSVVSTTRNASASATTTATATPTAGAGAGAGVGVSTVPAVSVTATTTATAASPSPSSSPSSSISLRDVGGVTQGELLRQEQEAGIIPVTQQAGQRLIPGNAGAGHNMGARSGRGDDDNNNNNNNNGDDNGHDNDEDVDLEAEDRIIDDQQPHARGPENVGMEDMGPQSKPPGSALDLTAAVGRPVIQGDITMGESGTNEVSGQAEGEEEEAEDDEMKEDQAEAWDGSKADVTKDLGDRDEDDATRKQPSEDIASAS